MRLTKIIRTYPGWESIKNGFLSLFWVSLCATGRLYGNAIRTDRLTWPLYISYFVSQHIELYPLALSRQMCSKNYWLRSIYQRRYFKTCSPLSLLTISNNTYLIVIYFVNTDKVTGYEETSDTTITTQKMLLKPKSTKKFWKIKMHTVRSNVCLSALL